MQKQIYCCGCTKDIFARLTDGREIYPHREDLADIPFWRCDTCGNYVGCHYKTRNPTRPLGNISTREIRGLRQDIHNVLDPLWKDGTFQRDEIYEKISTALGHKYHTGSIRSVAEARTIFRIVNNIRRELE